MTTERNHRILLIEDNPADVETVRRALERTGYSVELTVQSEGPTGRQHIRSTDGSPAADLVLLDLNVPGVDGRQLLEILDNSANWREVPVVVLTTSKNEQDVRFAYDHGANAYVVKPGDARKFLERIRSVCQFWLND